MTITCRAAAVSLLLPLVVACLPATEGESSEGNASAAVEAPGGERYYTADGQVRVGLIKMPYSGARNVAELSGGPDYLESGGLLDRLADLDVELGPTSNVKLRPDQEDDYGAWHRMGLANGHLARLTAENERAGRLTVALESNCTALLGVLAGLQDSDVGRPRRVALVFIDAHGDFNTPETTLSGMLGGMPVAVAAGMCLTNLRHESGLEPALGTEYVVMGAVRDTDPLEQELIDQSEIQHLTIADIRSGSDNIHRQMRRLSGIADLIYIHIDMDVLDPREVAGHPLTVANGPTSEELAAALETMFSYDKAAALGIASTPWGPNDPDGLSRDAAYNLIEGAIRGVQARQSQADLSASSGPG